MCKVSVIVPVYNVEKYLPECIDSLLKQTFEDVEFIFVNDGSTDLSSNILKKYKELDEAYSTEIKKVKNELDEKDAELEEQDD